MILMEHVSDTFQLRSCRIIGDAKPNQNTRGATTSVLFYAH